MPEFTRDELRDIQGTILSGFAHLPYASYLFLQIKDAAKVKPWLEKITPQITTGEPWDKLPDGLRQKPPVTLNIGFTYAGFEALRLPEETLLSFAREFQKGVAARSKTLGDTGASAPEHWEMGGPGTEAIHIILVLNAANEAALEAFREQQRQLLQVSQGGLIEVNAQHGHRPPSEKEAFGFLDGISQPKIQRTLGYPEPNQWVIRTGEFILGYLNEYKEYPLSPGIAAKNDPDNLLPPFPENAIPDCKDFGRHGSYLVYRKLAQDVPGFWNYLADNARRGPDGSPDTQDMVYLAAKCMGRWPSGAPLVLAPEKDDPALGRDRGQNNQFTYQPTDLEGLACPVGSHVRRCNPRDSRINEEPAESLTSVNRHRIIRRAVSFGADLFPREDVERGKIPLDLKDDHQERGLHFFAINASIGRQFEMIQSTWSNARSFNGLFDNKDPIIGDNDGSSHMTLQRDPIRQQLNHVPRFVTVRGGGYFFLPSITALRFLGSRL